MKLNYTTTKYILFCAIALVLLATAASCDLDDCDRSGCDYTDGPVAHPGIEAGIAGGASSASDVVENGCAECPFATSEIRIWPAAVPVETEEQARAICDGAEPPLHDLPFDGTYAQELAPGEYLACLEADEEDMICAGITVPAGGVVTFHIRYVFGPTSVAVYPAGEDAPSAERVFGWSSW